MWKTSPCTHTHTHARTHTTHTTHMHVHTRTQAAMSMRLFLRSYDTQNCSLVAFHHFQYILQETKYSLREGSRATSTLHKIRGSIINMQNYSSVLFLRHTNSDLELSDVACRLSNKATAERMNTKHYPNWVILIFSPSPTHELKTKGVETN